MSNLLDFDPVGKLPANWKTDEMHTISPVNGDKWRFFKPKYGPFFVHDLEVFHKAADDTWTKLAPATHYTLGYVYLDMKEHILQPVYTVVQILDNTLSGEFKINYHSLGGESTDIVHDLVIEGAQALLQPKYYTLEDIADMPDRLPPIDHEVLTDDVFGWNKVCDSVWALVYAIAGDPFKEHTHNVNSIVGLTPLLDAKASADMSHKAGIHNAQRILNHSGTVSLTLPPCVADTFVTGNVLMIEGGKSSVVTFQGTVEPADDVKGKNKDWLKPSAEITGPSTLNIMSFTYDSSGRPVVYFDSARAYTDTMFILMDVTWGSDATTTKRSGYTFIKETVTRGQHVAVKKTFELSRANGGLLAPNAVWYLTNSAVGILPDLTQASLSNGDTIKVMVTAGDPKTAPGGVTGKVLGYDGDTLRLTRLGAQLEFTWSSDEEKWIITGGR